MQAAIFGATLLQQSSDYMITKIIICQALVSSPERIPVYLVCWCLIEQLDVSALLYGT